MSRKNQYNCRILTLKAESEVIQHEEKFRDSRRGNRALIQRMKWLKNLNQHVNSIGPKIYLNNKIVPFKRLNHKLKVTIIHN